MTELISHIERLLLDHDCVIIPDFGGFMTHLKPASWVKEESLFLPPSRQIGFNPALKHNDGLLVQSYMATHAISFNEANQRLAVAFKAFHEALLQTKTVSFGSIGSFSVSLSGSVVFTPYQDRLLSPSYYGLVAFEIQPVLQLEVEPTVFQPAKQKRAPQLVFNPSRTSKRSRIALVAVAAVIFFFLFTSPIHTDYVGKQSDYAELIPLKMLVSNQSTVLEPKTDLDTTYCAVEQVPESMLHSAPESEMLVDATNLDVIENPVYYLIVTSSSDSSDGARMVKKLHKEGYESAILLQSTKMTRVSIQSFESKEEAYQFKRSLQEVGLFRDAWILSSAE